MRTSYQRLTALSLLLSLLCAAQQQVEAAPVSTEPELIRRVRRSILWRWNTLRPLGASCRDHSECGTKYCRAQMCSFRVFQS